jgi:TPR repeat protein
MITRSSRTTLAALLLCLLPFTAAAQPPTDPIADGNLPELHSKFIAGEPNACYKFAQHYMWKPDPNVEAAIYAGIQAGQAGHVEAQSLVGFLYKTQGDIDHAIIWTKFAADRGHVGAQFNLSSYYAYRDKEQALKYLILASRVNQNAALSLQKNILGATSEERQRAEQLAKDWKPVCNNACSYILGFDRCGICPLTEEEKRLAKK